MIYGTPVLISSVNIAMGMNKTSGNREDQERRRQDQKDQSDRSHDEQEEQMMMNSKEKGPCQVPFPDRAKLQTVLQPDKMVPRFSHLGNDKGRPPILIDLIPDVLKERRQWVCWEYKWVDGEEKKPPLNPLTGKYAKVNDPSTWASFEETLAAYYAGMGDGIGFMFTLEDSFCGIDFDDRRDGKSGEIEPWVVEIVQDMSSYTELSPSGEGLHIIVEAVLPKGGKKNSIIEIYSEGRYFTITGNHIMCTSETIEPRQEQLDILFSRYFESDSSANADSLPLESAVIRLPARPEVDTDIEAIIKKAKEGRRSDKFKKLMSGDHSGYDSQSEAELALCGIAAYYSGNDPYAIDEIMRRSGLFRPKWDEVRGNSTYGQQTIEKAIAGNGKKEAAPSADVSELEKSLCGYVDKALASANPAEVIFTDRVIEAFAKLKQAGSLACAREKQRLKGRVNLTDLNAAIKLKLKKKTDKANQGIGVIPPLIEHDTGYSVIREKPSGSIVETLSNFKINPRERLTLPDGREFVSGELVIQGDKKRSICLRHDDFISKRDLLASLGTSEAVWLGSDRDIQLLRAHMSEKEVARLAGIEVAGRHDDLIILPGLVISKDGPVESPSCQYVNPSRSGWAYAYSSRWPEDTEYRAAVNAVFQYMPNINIAQITVPIIGWIASLPWAAPIRTKAGWGGFPHVCIWGPKGAGKTAYIETMMRTCGLSAAVLPFSLPGTRFTRMDRSSCTNLIPICYDEYRVENFSGGSLSKFHEELRSLYNGGHEQRGRSDLTIQDYDLVSPIVLAGEDRPRDAALDERLILLNPSDNVIKENDNYRASYNKLMSAPLEAFALPYWAWSLAQTDWHEVLERQRECVVELAKEKGLTIPFRIINNLAIFKFGWVMFNRFGDHLEVSPEPFICGSVEDAILAALEQVMPGGRSMTTLDDLMMFISVMITNSRLVYGTHFTLKKDGNVVLRLQEAHAEVKKYARETSKDSSVLGWYHYQGLVKSMVGVKDSYVLEPSALADFESMPGSGRKQLRGVLLDPDILEKQLGIEKDIWLPDVRPAPSPALPPRRCP